jgi:hypothetical protein
LLIESLTRFTVRLPSGLLQRFCPGQAVDLPETVALRLLERTSGKVRVIMPPVQGDVIAWRSPLFGLCHGRVLDILDGQCLLVEHPRLEAPAVILRHWVRP